MFHLSLFLTSVAPTLVIPYIPYNPFPIVQIIPILTTPHTCINTLSTSCCSLSLIINFDTPRPSSAPPVNHGLIVITHLTPSSTCATPSTTQQSPLDKARLKAMDAQRCPMPCPIPEPTSPSSGGHSRPFPIGLTLLPIRNAWHISDSLYAVRIHYTLAS